jgi:hypothetical protein
VSLFVLKQKVTKKFKRNNPTTHKAIAGPVRRGGSSSPLEFHSQIYLKNEILYLHSFSKLFPWTNSPEVG